MIQSHKAISVRKHLLLAVMLSGVAMFHAGNVYSEEVSKSNVQRDATAPNDAAIDSSESAVKTTENKIPTLAKPKRKLSPELLALRDQVRKTLSQHARQSFNTRQNSVAEIMNYCLSYGCNAEITLAKSTGSKRENAIACLCWNIPCAGYELLKMCDGRIVARLGYGAQQRPSQFLAMMAFAHVQPSYPLRVGETQQTVANLVEAEKLQCRTGTDLSMTLIGMSHYADFPIWKNDLGEEWSVERLLREEIDKPAMAVSNGGIDRLLGIAYAVRHRKQHNLPIEGDFERAEKYLEKLHAFAWNLQNPDGSWGYYLTRQEKNSDEIAAQRSTAYIMEWLSLSLPDEQLEDARLIAGVKYLLQLVNGNRFQRDVAGLATQEIGSYTRALHALSFYNDRYFSVGEEEKSSLKPKATESASFSPAILPLESMPVRSN